MDNGFIQEWMKLTKLLRKSRTDTCISMKMYEISDG